MWAVRAVRAAWPLVALRVADDITGRCPAYGLPTTVFKQPPHL